MAGPRSLQGSVFVRRNSEKKNARENFFKRVRREEEDEYEFQNLIEMWKCRPEWTRDMLKVPLEIDPKNFSGSRRTRSASAVLVDIPIHQCGLSRQFGRGAPLCRAH